MKKWGKHAVKMSILDYGKIIFFPIDDLIEWLQSKRLLAVQSSCPVCGTTMDIKVRNDVQDKRR